ncbi:hypothetical protein FRC08_011257 [Ceratobasidium sp. 394]|nr:hypothetical protein FRC08_011257 [Ceratobasidium sp. 394]
MGSMKSVMLENPPIADLRVFLPSLRFFSLELVFSSHWGSHMLKIIDAPGVETFLLFFEFAQNTSMAELVRFISSGRLNGALQEESAAGQPGAGPIFPSLRTLALPHFPFNDAIQADLLNAYASAEWYF